jgi:hypothetical protein
MCAIIEVAGVTVPRAAVARLAIVLIRTGNNLTGDRLAQAIDKHEEQRSLTAEDARAIVAALREHPIEGLEPLEESLNSSPGLAEFRAAPLPQGGRVLDVRGHETTLAVTSGPSKRDLEELREKRLAANEAFFRELNEKLEHQTDGSDDTLIVVCECSDEDCAQRLELTRREYEAARSEPVLFVVFHGHVDPEIEEVISRTERYELVRKIGVGREVATRLESTSDSAARPVGDDQ